MRQDTARHSRDFWRDTFVNTDETKTDAVVVDNEADISSGSDSGAGAASNIDRKALHKIGYGLYVIITNDGKKDNGCIVNTLLQVADNPLRLSVCINKANYSYEIVHNTGILNACCLSTEAPFKVFENFGFQSGRNADKFGDCAATAPRSANGLIYLPHYINAFFSLKVEKEIDLGSHGMFICEIVESKKISDEESMTYSYYQTNVKPKPQPTNKKGYVCKVCGYIYEGDTLPDDFICPVCKHTASDFEKLG